MSSNARQSTEEKHEIEPVENVGALDKLALERGVSKGLQEDLVKSTFDTLTVTQSLWVFRRCFIYIFLAFTGYIMEGYEVGHCATWCR